MGLGLFQFSNQIRDRRLADVDGNVTKGQSVFEKLFEQDLKASDEVKGEKWSERPFLDRVKELFARLLAPWL